MKIMKNVKGLKLKCGAQHMRPTSMIETRGSHEAHL